MIGIVLAGGRASRMGGDDKGALRVAGSTILNRVVATMRAQCDHVLINAPAERSLNIEGCALVPDEIAGQPGPLAGVLAGLDYVAAHYPDAPFVVTVPTDTPFLPVDLVARLQDRAVADRALAVCARSGDNTHHVVTLWSVSLRGDIRRALVEEGIHKVKDVLARHPVAYVTWPVEPVDPFFNVNTPEQLKAADRMAASLA